MFSITNNNGQDITDYIKSVLRYPLFSDNDQNNEFEVRQVEGGFLFIPIYPITFVIDEPFYNRLFSILNLALTPMYTLIRPLTMQVVTLDGRESSSSRGLFLPARKGKPQRLTGTMKELVDHGLKKKDRIFTVTKNYLHHEMDRGAKAAGVKRIRIHDLSQSYQPAD